MVIILYILGSLLIIGGITIKINKMAVDSSRISEKTS